MDTVELVRQVIILWLRHIMDMVMKVSTISFKDVAILQRLEIPILEPRPKKVRVLRWIRSSQDWVKLNTDGSSFGNPRPLEAGGHS